MSYLDFLKPNNINNLLTIIFGITSGVFTLIGLVSIYVSINRQHKIQRGREIIWDLASLQYKYHHFNNPLIGKELINLLKSYENILNTDKDFSNMVIDLARQSIMSIIIIWFFTLIIVSQSLNNIEYLHISFSFIVIMILLFSFRNILKSLNDIKSIGDLPDLNSILNIDKGNEKINSLFLAGMAMKLRIQKQNKNLHISVGFPVSIHNFSVLTYVYNSSSSEDLIYKSDIKLIDKINVQRWMPNQELWYELFEFDIPKKDKISFQIGLNSEQASIHVHYLDIDVETLKSLDVVEPYIILPNSCIETHNTKRGEVLY